MLCPLGFKSAVDAQCLTFVPAFAILHCLLSQIPVVMETFRKFSSLNTSKLNPYAAANRTTSNLLSCTHRCPFWTCKLRTSCSIDGKNIIAFLCCSADETELGQEIVFVSVIHHLYESCSYKGFI